MGRHVLSVGVVLADTALLVAGHRSGALLWVIPLYALAIALVIALGYRKPTAAFVTALILSALTGGAYALLLWAAYQAGHGARSRLDAAVVVGAAVGGFGAQFATWSVSPRTISNLVVTYAVFVALPLLVGRYLAQNGRLVSALDRHNRQLRQQRELIAEQERLRERLRIARDMHDSIGRRLSLVAVQAAALEVATLPEQRQPVRQLAAAARDAMDELHELVGALRAEDDTRGRSYGMEAIGAEAIGAVVADFRAAGVPVTLRERGEPRALSVAAGQAAYRMVEEGLTNAAKHAPGQPVAVRVEWEPDALLLTVVNPLPDRPAPPDSPGSTARAEPTGAGHGLSGLSERLGPVGGLLDHRRSDGGFRLFAMLPTVSPEPLADAPQQLADSDEPAPPGGIRTVGIGFAIAALMFVILPAAMLLGAA
jgi:signal transduction histidine kinase